MKKAIKIILVILLILIAAAAAVLFWQRDNLAALKLSMGTSKDDLSQMISDNVQKVDEAIQKVDGITVRDLTDDEKEALRNSEISREDLLDRLTSGQPVSNDGGAAAPADPSPAGSTVQEDDAPSPEAADSNTQKLSQYLAELYVLKAEYSAWLEDAYADAIAEYSALDPSERTSTAKYKIGMSYLRTALEKEKECDQLMADLEDKILTLLTEMGADTSLVDDIQSAYEDEKELKKAYYLGLHS